MQSWACWGGLVVRVFGRGWSGGFSGGVQSESSAQCKGPSIEVPVPLGVQLPTAGANYWQSTHNRQPPTAKPLMVPTAHGWWSTDDRLTVISSCLKTPFGKMAVFARPLPCTVILGPLWAASTGLVLMGPQSYGTVLLHHPGMSCPPQD